MSESKVSHPPGINCDGWAVAAINNTSDDGDKCSFYSLASSRVDSLLEPVVSLQPESNNLEPTL